MTSTLLLDTVTWDLLLDAAGNIAVATEPYSLAQDAASAIRTYQGECYYDTTIGVPYLQQIFGKRISVTTLKSLMQAAALTVPDVATATVVLNAITSRIVTGQVQVTSKTTGQPSAANFTVQNPQGAG